MNARILVGALPVRLPTRAGAGAEGFAAERRPDGFGPEAVRPAAAHAARPGRFVPPDGGDRVFLRERRPLAECAGRR